MSDAEQTDSAGADLPAQSETGVTRGDAGIPQLQLVPVHWEMSPVTFGLVFLIAVFFSYQLVGSLATIAVIGFDLSGKNVQPMRLATAIAQFLFLLGPAVVAVRLRKWKPATALRLHAPGLVPSILVVCGVIALQFVLQGYMEAQEYILTHYLIPPSVQPLLKKLEELIQGMYRELLVMRSPAEMLFVWFVVALTPAICEEAVFRGVAQSAFERGMRLRWAFLLTGSVFAVFHLYPTQFVPLALIGVFLSVVVWRGNSLYLGIIGHLANNSFAVVTLYLSGDAGMTKDITAGPGGLASAGIALAALAAFALFLALFWKATRSNDSISPQAM